MLRVDDLLSIQKPEYIRYVGRMKQPLQKIEVEDPSMFAVADPEKVELCLIILTPGAFSHAYNFIKKSEARQVKIFFPTLRPEFISDIMNLYMALKDVIAVRWVFPESFNHYSFSLGHERCETYRHSVDPIISIEYRKNDKVDRLYDIVVRCEEGMHYFSLYMTSERFSELFYCKPCTFIHVSKSAPIYGGFCYDSLYVMDHKFKKKLVPFDFTSIEDYIAFKGGIINFDLYSHYPRFRDDDCKKKKEEPKEEVKDDKEDKKCCCNCPPTLSDMVDIPSDEPEIPSTGENQESEEPNTDDIPNQTPSEEEKVGQDTEEELKEVDPDGKDSALQGSEQEEISGTT